MKVDEILTIHEDCTLYQEQKKVTANAFLETPFENDPIFSVAINGFSDYYNVDDEKWGYLVVSHRQNPKCSHASFYWHYISVPLEKVAWSNKFA